MPIKRKEIVNSPTHKCVGDTPKYVTRSPEHGSFSLPGVTSLGEDGGPTVIGEGRVQARIPPDDVWYTMTADET